MPDYDIVLLEIQKTLVWEGAGSHQAFRRDGAGATKGLWRKNTRC